MTKQQVLRLVIELNADETAEFLGLAKTDDAAFYEGIAKSLVLGAGKVVDPQFVFENIELLVDLAEYGCRGDLPVQQKWADGLSFTRGQLQKQFVKDAICTWATHFGSSIENLAKERFTPYKDQYKWFVYDSVTSVLLESLRNTIRSNL